MSPHPHHLDHDDEDPPYDPYTALPPAEPYVPEDYQEPAATRKQLSYLRLLAERTGQTFAYPKTRRQASTEINRLTHTRPSTRTERRVERKLIADQIATGPRDSARVRDEEISGYGSSATWTQNREQDPPPVEDPGPAASHRRRALRGGQAHRARPLPDRGRREGRLWPKGGRDRQGH